MNATFLRRWAPACSLLALLATGCAEPEPCDAVACGINSHCDESTVECTCDQGFSGDPKAGCESVAVCTDQSCSGHGACSVSAGKKACACSEGWTGERCDRCAEGYGFEGGQCLNKKMVPCRDTAPEHAAATVVDVQISFEAGAWNQPAECEWSCDTGFAHEGEACIDQKQVACAPVTAPAQAHSVDALVTVTYGGGGWSTPADCAWACDTDYALEGAVCLHEKQVACTPATAPTHAHSVDAPVTVTYSGGAWSTPADCGWACDTDYAIVDGACASEKQVACHDAAPANAASVDALVTVTYSGGVWSTPADCAWNCVAGYVANPGTGAACVADPCANQTVCPAHSTCAITSEGQVACTCAAGYEGADCATCAAGYVESPAGSGTCALDQCASINCAANEHCVVTAPDATDCACDADFVAEGEAGACIHTKDVPCAQVQPANAASTLINVQVTYTDANGWSAPIACVWECDAGYHRSGDSCVANASIGWCAVQWPQTFSLAVGQTGTIFGQVYSAGATDQAVPAPGLVAKACSAAAPLTAPVDLDLLSCTDATLNTSFDASVSNNDEYMASLSFAAAGDFAIVFAFSGDGGETWTACDKVGIPAGATVDPAIWTVQTVPANGGFELWDDPPTLPVDWTAAAGVGVMREETLKHSGNYSVKLTRLQDSNAATEFAASLVPVVAGRSYTLTMHFLDDNTSARGGIGFRWLAADGTEITNTLGLAYSTNQPGWQAVTKTIAAPADAVSAKIVARVYKDAGSATGGFVYLDDVSVVAVP